MLQEHLPPPKVKRLKKENQRSVRTYTKIEQLCFVQLRFGSLTNFDQVARSYTWIGKALHLNPRVVRKTILRFISNGHQVIDRRSLALWNHKNKCVVPPDVVKQLVDPALLTQWSPFSLSRRLALIEAKFGVVIKHRRQLWSIY
jgi:hypothetical protein